MLRHELEHVRQYRQSLFLLRASTAILGGLEDHLSSTMTLVRSLYIAIPTERAADEAGRRLAVARLGAPPASERGAQHDVLLFGGDDGPSPSEIVWRMIANLMFLPAYSGGAAVKRFELSLNELEAIGSLAELLWPRDGPAFGNALAADPGFQAARRRLLTTMEAVGRLDSPETVRASIRRCVLEAEAAAGDVLAVAA